MRISVKIAVIVVDEKGIYFMKRKELIANYKNGNYTVKLYEDGTKIKMNNLDNFTPSFAESIDCCITEKCSGNCQYCYLSCDETKPHADLNQPFFDTVHKGTELAINVNDLSHPDLENFLIRMRDKGVFVNTTINQLHLISNIDKLKDWQERKLVWGIGISLVNSKDKKFLDAIKQLKNVVVHTIDGCLTKEDLENLANNDIKLLILGFKHKGRGLDYYKAHKEDVDNNIAYLKEHLYDYKSNFCGFGFDNLANDHLCIRERVGEDKWAIYHMGEEGEFTFFVDAVNKTYAISSMETEHIFPIEENDTLDTMFHKVREIAKTIYNF